MHLLAVSQSAMVGRYYSARKEILLPRLMLTSSGSFAQKKVMSSQEDKFMAFDDMWDFDEEDRTEK